MQKESSLPLREVEACCKKENRILLGGSGGMVFMGLAALFPYNL